MKFQINQKVVALSNSTHKNSQEREKGKIYTVTALSCCAGCGTNYINIDNKHALYATVICSCRHSQPNQKLGWTDAHYFAPLTEEAMEALAEAEEYELAAIIRDNLSLQNH